MKSGIVLTLDELKEVRNSYGYNLIKKPVRIHLKPCKCGRKRPEKWCSHDGYYYICPWCHRRGDEGKTVKERKENWNKMM
jgi:hypothetical protein